MINSHSFIDSVYSHYLLKFRNIDIVKKLGIHIQIRAEKAKTLENYEKNIREWKKINNNRFHRKKS